MGNMLGYDGYQLQAIIARDLLLARFSAVVTGAPNVDRNVYFCA